MYFILWIFSSFQNFYLQVDRLYEALRINSCPFVKGTHCGRWPCQVKGQGKTQLWNLIREFELHYSENLSYMSLQRSFETKSRQCRIGQCQNINWDSNCCWMKIEMIKLHRHAGFWLYKINFCDWWHITKCYPSNISS